jgi:hypothetical protein
MKKTRTLIAVTAMTALLAVAMSGQASADVPGDTKALLGQQGAIVLDKTLLPLQFQSFVFQAVDCLGSTNPLCANYANSAVTYGGFLMPCRFGMCNPITPNPTPIPGFPLGGGFQLAPDEAIVLYGKLPPAGSYIGFETSFHERNKNQFPNLAPLPLRPGENPPPPATPDRIVVSSAVGDTENTLVLHSAVDPDDPSGLPVFAKIITGNDNVAQLISSALIASGFPAEAITVKALPSTYVFAADSSADTFREILRMARPFDQQAMNDYIASQPFDPWRVTVPGIAFAGYPEVTHTERDTGTDETAQTCNITKKFTKFVQRKHGKPDAEYTGEPRDYDDEFCIDSGTYCWGNNNDALYYDFRNTDDSLGTFDLGDADSRLVVVGVDHQAIGHSEVWNWDIYDPSNGLAQETFLFSDAQADDYGPDFDEFCGLNPGNCSCGSDLPNSCSNWSDERCENDPDGCAAAVDYCRSNFPNPLDGNLFWFQLRETCAPEDAHCRELDPISQGVGTSRQLMNRVYLSPETETGPSLDETEPPTAFYYE